MHSPSQKTFAMALAALGIVFGDIGTSPIYAIDAALRVSGLAAHEETILGIVSLIFWTLGLVVSMKYLLFITRADNDGEGGIFAIVALLRASSASNNARMMVLTTGIAMASAALLFADSLITPALSIMAATEGMKALSADIDHWAMLASISLLVILFGIQRFGTGALSRWFTPIMVGWFLAIGGLGAAQIWQTPAILAALLPQHAVHLLSVLRWPELLNLLGAILLAVTGAEAIYADMGHFGRRPIRLAWYVTALYALLLSYFGQGAWLLQNHTYSASEVSPFFGMIPTGGLAPMIVLAMLASFIASQAVISGMFSLARQAIQMEYLPRLRVVQTSASERGQIYVPKINGLLAVGCILLVVGFGSSSTLASAYGFAVAATMLLTTLAFTLVIGYVWRWSLWKVLAFCGFALPLDVLFFAATVTKLPSGHYVTLMISVGAFWLLLAWMLGNRYLMGRAQRLDMPLSLFSELVNARTDLHRQPRPAVFFQHLPFPADMEITPTALLRQVQLTSMLYQPTIIVDFLTADVPRMPDAGRIDVRHYDHNIHRVNVTGGFTEPLTIEGVVSYGHTQGWWKTADDIVFYSGREDLRASASGGLSPLIKWPFLWLHQFDESLPKTLHLPAIQYVELGMTIDV